MKDLSDPLFNSQQIFVPPAFPHILKRYAKAAIRTQPYDLLTWSASYFKALAEGRSPLVKTRLEYPVIKTKGGLTTGYLKLLIRQFQSFAGVEKGMLVERWNEICLDKNELKQILCLGGTYNEETFPLYKFVAIAAGFLSKNLTQTMITLCEIYTEEPDGGSAAIPSGLFINLYSFLAPIDASKKHKFINGQLEGLKKSLDIGEDTTDDQFQDIRYSGIKDSLVIHKMRRDSQKDHEVSEEVTSDENNKISTNGLTTSDEEHKLDVVEDLNLTTTSDEDKYENDKFEVSESPDEDKSKFYISESDVGEISEQAPSDIENSSQTTEVSQDDKTVVFETNSARSKFKDVEQFLKEEDEKVKLLKLNIETSEDSPTIIESQSKGELFTRKSSSIDSLKVEVNPNAKGVVNPILKGLFDNVADNIAMPFSATKDENLPEVIIVPPVPGIGPVVDDDIAEEFLKYVRDTAADQNNMLMPRDIRHLFCPPLEKNDIKK